jgi:hypothetical protein
LGKGKVIAKVLALEEEIGVIEDIFSTKLMANIRY